MVGFGRVLDITPLIMMFYGVHALEGNVLIGRLSRTWNRSHLNIDCCIEVSMRIECLFSINMQMIRNYFFW